MESSEAAARRMTRIASHLAATPQNSCTSSLASMVCSSSSSMQSSSRKDGRLPFAKQDSHLPGYCRDFIRECQGSNASSVTHGNARKDSRLLFARQGSNTQAFYMRECVEYQVSFPSEEGGVCKQHQSMAEEPDSSRRVSPGFNQFEDNSANLNAEPLFARTVNKGGDRKEVIEASSKGLPPSDSRNREFVWLPRMDIVESGASYVITIELPGVLADGIRVEVNEDRLLVSGSRSTECWTDSTEQNEKAIYHCKELSQGPFRVQWPMPKNVNLDDVSAEFMDGFLRIFLPKNTHLN